MNIEDSHQQQQLVGSPDLNSNDNLACGKGKFETPFVADAIMKAVGSDAIIKLFSTAVKITGQRALILKDRGRC